MDNYIQIGLVTIGILSIIFAAFLAIRKLIVDPTDEIVLQRNANILNGEEASEKIIEGYNDYDQSQKKVGLLRPKYFLLFGCFLFILAFILYLF